MAPKELIEKKEWAIIQSMAETASQMGYK